MKSPVKEQKKAEEKPAPTAAKVEDKKKEETKAASPAKNQSDKPVSSSP